MDDDEDILNVTADMLRVLGYEPVLVHDGQEAVTRYGQALATGRPFYAVILDLTIPGGMGGKDAVGKLLALDPRAHVIVTSGYSNDPVLSDHLLHGFQGVIEKPFTLAKLSAVLQTKPAEAASS